MTKEQCVCVWLWVRLNKEEIFSKVSDSFFSEIASQDYEPHTMFDELLNGGRRLSNSRSPPTFLTFQHIYFPSCFKYATETTNTTCPYTIFGKHRHVPNMTTNSSMPRRTNSIVKTSLCGIGAFHRISTIHHTSTFIDLITITRIKRIYLFKLNTSLCKHLSDYCPTSLSFFTMQPYIQS